MDFYDNTHVEFVGFEPKANLRQAVAQAIENIVWEAPSDSSIKVTIAKYQSLFKANCRIASTVGLFSGNSNSESPVAAVKLLEKDVVKKLQRWKSNRTLVAEPITTAKPQRAG